MDDGDDLIVGFVQDFSCLVISFFINILHISFLLTLMDGRDYMVY